MPVATEPEEEKPFLEPNLIIAPEDYQSQVVDTRKVEYDGLATYIGGMKWACDYYSQIQGRDSAAASFQDDLPAPFGQYKVIRGFELVVQDPLSGGQNSGDTRGFTRTGSSVVYSIVTPQVGDVFIADSGNGRNVALMVTSTNRLSIYAESPTAIEYRITHFADEPFMAKLNSRVVETLFFSKENYRNGVKCLLNTEEVNISQRLGEAYFRLMNLYLRDFYSERYHTLLVPGQDAPTYDPAAVHFVRSILTSGDHKLIHQITELGVSHDVFSQELTVWDAIATRDANLLYSVSKKMAVVPIAYYRTLPWMASIYYSGIKQVVSPVDVGFSVNHEHHIPHDGLSFVKAQVRQRDIGSILPQLGLVEEEPKDEHARYIKRIVEDDFYIFSEAFYEDKEGKSMLEQMVYDRLRGRAIDLGDLADLADYARKFDNLERFYYIPIILTLIKLAPGVL